MFINKNDKYYQIKKELEQRAIKRAIEQGNHKKMYKRFIREMFALERGKMQTIKHCPPIR